MIKVENYPNAYKEVYVILKHTNENDVRKIPKSFINQIELAMNQEYNFKLNINEPFKNQKLLRETKIILAYISLNYWATNEQRDRIKQKFKQDMIDEENKKTNYLSSELFKNKQIKREEKVINEPKNEIIKYREVNLFSKIFKKIITFFIKK